MAVEEGSVGGEFGAAKPLIGRRCPLVARRRDRLVAHDYVDRVVRNFVKQRDGDERFANWALRAEEADLR